MADLLANRRGFLKSAAAGASVAIVPSASAYTVTTDYLTEHQARTVLQLSRQLYPHDFLGDRYYGGIVSEIDAAAAEKPTAMVVADGVTALDAALGVKWVDLSSGYQLKVVREQIDSPLVQLVKGKTVASLYNNPLVWRHFGYEGESFSHGGYIHRGFDDLNWLPDPPEEASPKVG